MKKTGYIAWPRALERGTLLNDAALLVSLKPEDALRYDGLWPGGHTSRLFEVTTEHDPEARGPQMAAPDWTVSRELAAKDHLHTLSQAFVDFEDDMLEEQLQWRQALLRSKTDASRIEEALQQALAARSLKNWAVVRAPSVEVLRRAPVDPQGFYSWCGGAAKLAWEAWDKEADEDDVYDHARRVAWNAWYHPVMFDADDAWEAHDDVSPVIWDAWTALVTYYAALQGWVETEPHRFAEGIRDAYAHGLVVVKPTGRGVLQWAV